MVAVGDPDHFLCAEVAKETYFSVCIPSYKQQLFPDLSSHQFVLFHIGALLGRVRCSLLGVRAPFLLRNWTAWLNSIVIMKKTFVAN